MEFLHLRQISRTEKIIEMKKRIQEVIFIFLGISDIFWLFSFACERGDENSLLNISTI